jgi:hypothetical protein
VRIETWVFGSGTFFFVPLAFIYGLLSSWEPVGFAALLLTGGLSAMVGLYFSLVAQRIDPRPEDDPAAEVADGAGDLGFYNPRSIWPILMAGGAAVLFLGLAVDTWLLLIGFTAFALMTLGLVFEHYLGEWRR